ncbi:MAG: hypothetical protein KDA22_10570, partial [Phycisphaerales bacterium]|nr:hypothetical protein [Phycisphaerales bacterium]
SVAAFASDVLARLDQGDLDRVVIDLRFNGGGNSALLAPLVEGLAARERWGTPGATMVLIGHGTFSSAQLNAVELKRRVNALLVGQPTGQRPNAYGEIRQFTLPNSGLTLGHSTKRFVTDPEDRPSTMPDVPVAVTISDWREGRDPVLAAAIDWHPGAAAE